MLPTAPANDATLAADQRDSIWHMTLEDNNTGERRAIAAEDELLAVLETKLTEGADVSLGTDKDHYVQVIPCPEKEQFYVGYKDARGFRGFVAIEPCCREKAKEFFLNYYRGTRDWRKGFAWVGIRTGPMWLGYAYLAFFACLVSFIAWSEGKTQYLWAIWASAFVIMAVVVLITRRRRVAGGILGLLGTMRKG